MLRKKSFKRIIAGVLALGMILSTASFGDRNTVVGASDVFNTYIGGNGYQNVAEGQYSNVYSKNKSKDVVEIGTDLFLMLDTGYYSTSKSNSMNCEVQINVYVDGSWNCSSTYYFTKDYKPTFHLYQLQIDPKVVGGDVQTLKAKLEEKGVTNIPHFGPIYRFAAAIGKGFNEKKIAKTCPVTEYVFDKCYTHLPIYGLTAEQLKYMADAIVESVAEMKAGK